MSSFNFVHYIRKENYMYLILVDGFVIIEKPMQLDDIIKTFGPVQLLEKKGFILKKVSDV